MKQTLHSPEWKSLDLEYFLHQSFNKHLLNANNVLGGGDKKNSNKSWSLPLVHSLGTGRDKTRRENAGMLR